MNTRALLVLLAVLSFLVGTHWLLGYSLAHFFAIGDPTVRATLVAILVCLSVGFPLAMALHWAASTLATRIIYFVTAFWLGWYLYLLGATGLAWVIAGLTDLLGIAVDMGAVFGALVGLATAVTLYGLWNALRLQVSRHDVAITNLPESWDGETIAHLSDLHIGPIRRTGFLRQLARRLDTLAPTVVLITGDLFDGACRDPSPFIDSLDGLRAKKGVFFATGNHEHYLGVDRALNALEKTTIHVLEDEIVEIDGVQIVGAGYPAFKNGERQKNPFDSEGAYDPEKPSVLLYHTPTSIDIAHEDLGSQQLNTYLAPDTDFSAQRRNSVDLQLSGHTHAGQIAPFGWLTRKIFNGYDYGLHTLDGFNLYTSSGTGTWGPPIRTVGKSEIVLITLRAKKG